MKNQIFLFDSFKNKKVLFESIKSKKVKIYVCGPTVYDYAHLGHARSSIVFDLLKRVLILNGYEVYFVKNFTDIDNKIILKSKESGKNISEITDFYINSYKEDMLKLNILENELEPTVIENLSLIKDMIKSLLEKNKAYISADGIYMNSGKEIINPKSRLNDNIDKESLSDFAIWKFSNDEYSFDFDFGRGRPGWHIECSTLIKNFLAYKDENFQIDIHGGGMDLIFPHHHNESIQTKEDSGQELSKYWVHNGFVRINGEKMSKSLKNTFLIKDFLKEYHGEVIRFYFLQTHYSKDINFNEIDLIASKKRLDRLYRVKKELFNVKSKEVNEEFKDMFLNLINNDLNINESLVFLESYLNKEKDLLEKKAVLEYVSKAFGVLEENPYIYFQFGIENKKEIEDLILKRNIAKIERNYELSDSIRNILLEKGISLFDTIDGTFWELKNKNEEEIINL